jgi:hypothetical protein
MNWATSTSGRSRRMACAVFMQPYRKSKELDEVWKIWKQAKSFFDAGLVRRSRSSVDTVWFDDGEGVLFKEQAEEFAAIVKTLKASIPKEMLSFLGRLSSYSLKTADVAHLKFAAKVISDNPNLSEGEETRLALFIEAEGKRYLADKKTTPTIEDKETEE